MFNGWKITNILDNSKEEVTTTPKAGGETGQEA